jgi:hypothetical protein
MKSRLRSRWPLVFSVMLVALIAAYYYYMYNTDSSSRATFIITCGIAGAIAIVLLSLYVLRKNIYRYRWGSTQMWLQTHTYIGVISLVLVIMHSGFDFTGTFSILLLVIFFLVIASGVVGSLIYNIVPRSLNKYGREIKADFEIMDQLEVYLNDADQLVSTTSEEFKDFYMKKIRPFFLSNKTQWKYLFTEERELINKRRKMMKDYRTMVPGQDIYDLNILTSILVEREKLSFMLTKVKVQSAWLNFHMPLTLAMLAMIAVHVWSIIYF